MNGQNIGYVRVSSLGQNTERQLMDIELDKIFEDRVSGKNTDRPELTRCLSHLREHDVLHVHSIDRLARNLKDLQSIVEKLTSRGVTVNFHKEHLIFESNNTSPMHTLMFQMLGAFAEFERTLTRERQREGIEAAKARGQKLGAPAKLSSEQVKELRLAVNEPGADKSVIAKRFGVSRPTLYKLIA